MRVHRLVWETFKGPIPEGMEIDHFDTNKENNRLDNLILCSHKENMNNPKTLKKFHVPKTEFGRKFFEHYGIIGRDDIGLYQKEYLWYRRHGNKCRWEF